MARRRGAPPAPTHLGSIFVVITPGLENVLAEELTELGLQPSVTEGGCKLAFDWKVLAKVVHCSRVAAGCLVRLGTVRAPSLDALAQAVRKLPWAEVAHPTQPVEVDVASHRSRLRRKDAVAKKVQHAIRDALRGPRKSGRPVREPLGVKVRLVDDKATISVDAVGDRMHRRGWRRMTARAPIRENLAAAALWAADWSPGEVLVDPMCGSGTFAIEAATWSMGVAPGTQRGAPAYQRFVRVPPRLGPPPPSGRPQRAGIYASDRDPTAVQAALQNAKRAGMREAVSVLESAFADLRPPDVVAPGLLICNPPYGARLGNVRAMGTWVSMGKTLRSTWSGWRVAMVAPSPSHIEAMRLDLEPAVTFSNGGIGVGVYVGSVR